MKILYNYHDKEWGRKFGGIYYFVPAKGSSSFPDEIAEHLLQAPTMLTISEDSKDAPDIPPAPEPNKPLSSLHTDSLRVLIQELVFKTIKDALGGDKLIKPQDVKKVEKEVKEQIKQEVDQTIVQSEKVQEETEETTMDVASRKAREFLSQQHLNDEKDNN